MSFMFITLMFVMIPRGFVSLKRINEILDTDVSIKDGTVDSSPNLGTIEFRDVSFSYADAEEPVLQNITFKVEKGQTVAFIGSTGSGKSTLINLIPRFFDVTSGEILVYGINVKAYKKSTLHDKIGYVPQKANLFSGDITSNMQMSKENITDDEIQTALDIAQCSFIEKVDDGFTQPVSAGGKNFSGGQKQRLYLTAALRRVRAKTKPLERKKPLLASVFCRGGQATTVFNFCVGSTLYDRICQPVPPPLKENGNHAPTNTRRGFYLFQCRFCLFCQRGKCRGVSDSNFGKHLAV